MGAVIMTNSDRGGELIADVLHDVAQAYEWQEVEDLAPAPGIRTSMMQYVGAYRFPSGTTCKIMIIGDNLYLQMLPQPPVALLPVSETIYMLQRLEGEIIFLTDGEGMVDGLRLRQQGTDLVAAKIISG